jgi:threonine aldolase
MINKMAMRSKGGGGALLQQQRRHHIQRMIIVQQQLLSSSGGGGGGGGQQQRRRRNNRRSYCMIHSRTDGWSDRSSTSNNNNINTYNNGIGARTTHKHSQLCLKFSTSNTTTSSNTIVDLRSDTVTLPSKEMLQTALTASLGDDVMGEDRTVAELQSYAADLFGMEQGLFVPTGTMSNLIALLSHCHSNRCSEIIVGATSHITLWEGGNISNVGGIHPRQVIEDTATGEMCPMDIIDCYRPHVDDHWPTTSVVCLENTHNMAGGVAISKSYMDTIGKLTQSTMNNIPIHVDGARIFNSSIAQNIPVRDLCEHVQSVSVCLSKGLGAPLGSVLVGDTTFIQRAKRARKRCGGGMRQAGVVASMGMYALQYNRNRLVEDHGRAQAIGTALYDAGLFVPRLGQIDTNIVYFAPPEDHDDDTNATMTQPLLTKDEFLQRLYTEYGVKISGGYGRGGMLYRLVTHMHIDDEGVDRAIEGIITLGTMNKSST